MLFNQNEVITNSSTYKLARIFSTLFIPPTFTLFSFTYLGFQLESSFKNEWLVTGVALIFTFLLPIIFFIVMLKKNKIVNQDAEMKEQRTNPFLFGLSLLVIGYFILKSYHIHPITLAFWFCYITNMAAVIIINKFWKISIHALGVAAPLTLFFFIQSWIVFILLIILFLVGWSRIKLKCHTFAQVIAGALFGFLSTITQLYLFMK